MSTDVKAFGGTQVNNKFVKELDKTVRQVKTSEKWRLEYVTYELALQEREEQGEERGFKKGKKEERLQSIRNLMESTNWIAEKAMNALKISVIKKKNTLLCCNFIMYF